MIERKAVHLVQGGLGITAPAALSQAAVNENLLHHFDPSTYAKALEQVFIQQPGADQLGIKRGHVTKIVVIEIQLHAWVWLDAKREKAAAQAWTGSGSGRISRGTVGLQGMVDRQISFVGQRIFEEHEWPVDLPFQCAKRESRRPRIMEPVEAATLEVDEGDANTPVEVVVPGRGIGGRAGEDACGNALSHSPPEISAVNRVQAAGPW